MCKVKGFDKKPAVRHCQSPGRVQLLWQGLFFLLENILRDDVFQSQQFCALEGKFPAHHKYQEVMGWGFWKQLHL